MPSVPEDLCEAEVSRQSGLLNSMREKSICIYIFYIFVYLVLRERGKERESQQAQHGQFRAGCRAQTWEL